MFCKLRVLLIYFRCNELYIRTRFHHKVNAKYLVPMRLNLQGVAHPRKFQLKAFSLPDPKRSTPRFISAFYTVEIPTVHNKYSLAYNKYNLEPYIDILNAGIPTRPLTRSCNIIG